ncbi:hypothetical protein Y032_0474g2120 [Ancylostoma ceylanicum]|uniref:Uncharacterized protein n=1 Tax=Ancylostoma ceylanicum TaxID=53326 RepID=A0A016WXM8_9BILA|nr:hypothetical protein Y032_0474g2120 [Ancylostoma ceylanicum]
MVTYEDSKLTAPGLEISSFTYRAVMNRSRKGDSSLASKDELQDKRALRFSDDVYRQPRNPYSWMYTMFDKRARNPYSWMNE